MIGIHQSQFLPWVSYFYKILRSDVFVVLDDVQFQKNGIQNRNMIKTPQGAMWFTVPVRFSFGAAINEVEVANTGEYPRLLKTLKLNYGRSEFFQPVYSQVEEIFDRKLTNLNELNKELLSKTLKMIGKSPEVYYSSDVKMHRMGKKKDDLVIAVIKHFKQKEYLSGLGALNYMDLRKFKKEGIKIYAYDFKYAAYKQLWDNKVGFLPDLSIIDAFFNNLERISDYIFDNGALKRIV